MQLVRQPPNTQLCGQACVAMLNGISLDAAIEQVGKTGKTTFDDLLPVIISSETMLCENWGDLPPQTCLVCVGNGAFKHWVVTKKFKIYDPSSGVFRFENPPKWFKEQSLKPLAFVQLE